MAKMRIDIDVANKSVKINEADTTITTEDELLTALTLLAKAHVAISGKVKKSSDAVIRNKLSALNNNLLAILTE